MISPRHALVDQHRLTDDAWIDSNFNDFARSRTTARCDLHDQETSSRSSIPSAEWQGEGTDFPASSKSAIRCSATMASGLRRRDQVAPYSYNVHCRHGRRVEPHHRLPGHGRLQLSRRSRSPCRSRTLRVAQLAVQPSACGTPHRLTSTMKPAFTARDWIVPKIVEVNRPSRRQHLREVLRAGQREQRIETAVIFVHGAGYLQNVDLVVVELLPRADVPATCWCSRPTWCWTWTTVPPEATAGAWRTAIYREMGHQVDDLLDGKAWLVQNDGVDPKRLGIYAAATAAS